MYMGQDTPLHHARSPWKGLEIGLGRGGAMCVPDIGDNPSASWNEVALVKVIAN